MGRGPAWIAFERESLSRCSDLWFWAFWTSPKCIPIIPHYLSLDIALDRVLWLTVTLYWIFKSVQKVCSALALYRDPDPAILRSGSVAELDWLLLHSAHKFLGPWEIRRPTYLTSSLATRAFFWDFLYPLFARQFKVRRVFLSEVSFFF